MPLSTQQLKHQHRQQVKRSRYLPLQSRVDRRIEEWIEKRGRELDREMDERIRAEESVGRTSQSRTT